MSLRRRSCDACFKSRRKCDLKHPSCGTCQRTNKICRYAYAPMSPTSDRPDSSAWSVDSTAIGTSTTSDTSLETLMDMIDNTTPQTTFGADSPADFLHGQDESQSDNPLPLSRSILQGMSSAKLSIRLLGSLGEVQPVEGSSESWQWVMNELKKYPGEFAQSTHTLFIHPQLYSNSMPKPIRAVFGASSAYSLINENNRQMIFRAVDAEVLELLQPGDGETNLFEELASLQALVLYQIMRLFHGGLEQRLLAEQQQVPLMAAALSLLTRSQSELHHAEAVCWYSWILAECIRRTAFVVYMLYGVNSIFRQGICIGFHTLVKLPLSTALSCWNSEDDHRNHPEPETTITYEMFTEEWVSSPRRLDPLEKFLLVPCKGINSLAAYDHSEMVYFST